MDFEGKENISSQEYKVFQLLQELNHDSIWGIAIRNVCAKPDPVTLRGLICELKSQADDCPETMLAILGTAYNEIIAL